MNIQNISQAIAVWTGKLWSLTVSNITTQNSVSFWVRSNSIERDVIVAIFSFLIVAYLIYAIAVLRYFKKHP